MSVYLNHLQSSNDLVTTYEATRAGFVALALEKNRRATPYIAEARTLHAAATQAKSPVELLKVQGIDRCRCRSLLDWDKHPILIFYEDAIPQGFSPKFFDPLTRFDDTICLIADNSRGNR